MKICTYNIWDDSTNFSKRVELLIQELNNNEIDFLALQEVKDEHTFNHILSSTNFDYGLYYEGLAVMSKQPLKKLETLTINNSYIQRVQIDDFAFTNVHLDYELMENKIKGINKALDFIEDNTQDHEIILGDFNDSPDNRIHFDLCLDNFTDLHKEYCHNINEHPLPTLDFDNNPRWRVNSTDEVPVRFDWIMLNTDSSFTISKASIIGTKETNNITPSDHYGVLVDVTLK